MTTITPTIGQMRMLASLRGQHWMVRPDAIQSFALAALDIPEKASNSISISFEDFYELRPPPVMDTNSIGHVFIHGMLVDSCPPIYEKLGLALRYSTIKSETEYLILTGATSILFHINSPGGTVAGNAEISEYIRDLPIQTASHCEGLACSAAYKIASATGAIIASKSAQVGNIGTILSWQDCTEFWANQGIEFKAITSEGADLKSTFHLEPDEAQLAFLQETIDEMGAEFREFVTAGREASKATLDPEIWRAGWYSGDHACELGLIDGIGTAEDAVNHLIGK